MAQAISAQNAASLDKDLMEMGGWSLDQLMELAGLSVSQAGKIVKNQLQQPSIGELTYLQSIESIHQVQAKISSWCAAQAIMVSIVPRTTATNRYNTRQTGGDGLVAARHLAQYGYTPTVYYPKEGKNELYQVSPLCSFSHLAIAGRN